MKMRQKLAAVLAASMVLTAMPVLTMAKSDNDKVVSIQNNKKDEHINSALKIKMKDTTKDSFRFFIEIANAEFDGSDKDGNEHAIKDPAGNVVTGIKYVITGDKEMEVRVDRDTATTPDKQIIIPLNNIKLKGGDATVAIDAAGSIISDMSPVIFARTNGDKALVSVEDAESIYKESKKVAKITVEEAYPGQLSGDIKFEIKHSDYEFVVNSSGDLKDSANNATCDIKGERGVKLNKSGWNQTENKRDSGVVTYTLDRSDFDSKVAGRITFEFVLKSTEKKPSTGKLNIKVSGSDVDDKTVTVGEVKDYGTVIEMDDKKVVDITAGGSDDITFTIKESVAKTFAPGREFDVEFDHGFISTIEDMNKDQEKKLKEELQDVVNKVDDAQLEVTDILYDDDDYATGFTVLVKDYKGDYKKDVANGKNGELEMKLEDVKVYVPLGYTGDVKVKASGRALGYDAETVAINAKKAIEIKTEPITVKVGLKSQLGGKVEVKEADKGIFEQGEWLLVKVDQDEKGLKVKDAKAKVTSGDLQIEDDVKIVNDNTIAVKIKRSSDEASTITLTDIEIYSDRTVPEGSYSLNVGGRAVAADWTLVTDANKIFTDKDITLSQVIKKTETGKGDKDKLSMNKSIEVEKFVVIGTPNTEDLTTANGLRKGTASFVIGSTKYVVNGKEAEMPVAAYTENGRTMIPVRFVANALGVNDTEIMYAKGTASVMVGSKTYSFKIGDKVAYINGVPAKTMLTAPVLKNDRCFVPVAELGELLGAEMNWDAATQTATFTVK